MESSQQTPGPPAAAPHQARTEKPGRFVALAVGSVGVVYGDIGTSPLYALREALSYVAQDGLDKVEILGLVSLIIWTLTLVVTCKYVLLMLRLDNHGEGGLLSLLALVQEAAGRKPVLIVIAIIGASLFYGDAIITPAISVLSAVEGLSLIEPDLGQFVLPITTAIIAILFWMQKRGTASIALWFGPITCVWFAMLAGMGIYWIVQAPEVLLSLSPVYAGEFLIDHAGIATVVIGLVFLSVTGAEALYVDLGHFGRGPIQFAWFGLVFPALALNYMGQGGLVLVHPEALSNPFFLMVPHWALVPLVLLATVATIIASQAVITGAFSVTRQAIQLGLLPRLAIWHTSSQLEGQIYVPAANWMLFAGVVALVWSFGSSQSLASAYGIAVSGDMIVTTSLAFIAVWKYKYRPVWQALLIVAPFALIEAVFVGSNALKIADGGYVPMMVACVLAIVMMTWVRGVELVAVKSHSLGILLLDVVPMLSKSAIGRAKGTAVYMTPYREQAPTALMHNFKHNNIIHEQNVVVTVVVENVPRVAAKNRAIVKQLNDEFFSVELKYGYMETPHVPKALHACSRHGIKIEPMLTSYFLSRRAITRSANSKMPAWQDGLYIMLTRLASRATDYYRIPASRVIELGQQISV